MPLLAVRGNGPAGAYGFGAASEKAAAMTAIASTTLSSAASSVTFSSIPTTYDDLLVVYYARSAVAAASAELRARFNSDSGSNYSNIRLEGNGSTAGSGYSVSQTGMSELKIVGNSATTGIFGVGTLNILNYQNTSNFKTVLFRSATDRNGSGDTNLVAALWRSTSALNSIIFETSTGANIMAGSVFALYGIKKAA